MKVTADTITDEQIRELRNGAHAYGYGDPNFVVRVCNRALGAVALQPMEARIAAQLRARARCAEILNARAKEQP